MSTAAPKVQYRQLGKSGLRVSVPIIGAMSFGSSKWASWVLDEEDAFKVLDAAWELGINTIDTANMYSNGESERIIGNWIKKCWGLVGYEMELNTILHPDLPYTRDYVNQGGLSRAAIFNAVEASLAPMGTPYIDLLQIHRYDFSTSAEETMKALHDIVASGKVRYIGASSMRAWQFALLNEVADKHGWTKFVSMQDEYSLLYREEEREMHAYCNYHGIGLILWAPLASGALARPLNSNTLRTEFAIGTPFHKELTEADRAIVNRVEEIATKKGVKMGQVALAWATAKVSSSIVGVNSVQRLAEGVATYIILTEEETKYLEEPYQPKLIRGHA
ncbi:hypothetical protein H0H87_008033 [Tephrocybe sp. NHM501043]|nr:hypothetical protein H0H87_008033 [Tephrocybe sp. NHM501043]